MYGLPQAYQLAYITFIKNLQLHRYTCAGSTPGLFKHATRDTFFCLVVDDFGVKYTAKNDALHLIYTLKKKYPGTTIDWSGRILLAINLYWEYTKCNFTLSMLKYVNKALSRLQHENLKMTNIHHIHVQHQTMVPRSSIHLLVLLPI